MSIVKATTTISVLRVQNTEGSDRVDRLAASYDDETGGLTTGTLPHHIVARGVRANIGTSRGIRKFSDIGLGGEQETIQYHMQLDPTDVIPTDSVIDEKTGLTYDVLASVPRSAFPGREYVQVSLTRTRGAA